MANKPGLIRRFLSSLILLVNMLVIIWLLLCIAAAYTSPLRIPFLALFSLSTPVAVLANVFFVVFWLFTSHILRSFGSLIILAVGYKVTLTMFGLNFFGTNDMEPRGRTIKIMSWNSHGMGVFNKPVSKAFDQQILDFLKAEDADILCLPEYSLTIDNVMKPYAEKIIKNNGYVDYRFQADNSLNDRIYLGTAVFSKYPFRNYEAHQLSRYIYMLQGDVILPHDRVLRVFFVHLTTFGLSDKDKDFIDDVKHDNNALKTAKNRADFFIRKFTQAYKQRTREVEKAIAVIRQSPYPILLCGDFNDLPGSYTYTTMRGKLNDAFVDKGTGLGRTYNRISPTVRIDHMFYDPTCLKLLGFQCPVTHLSDHNPIITNFEIITSHQP